MNTGLMHKLKNWVAGDPFEEEVFGYEDEFDAESRAYQRPVQKEFDSFAKAEKPARKNLKLVEHPTTNSPAQVVVIEPKAFEEALEIIDHLRNRKSVVLNLHLLDTAQSQRIVDFLSGATHAIDGHQQRIGDGVFMFTPSNVMITSDAQEALHAGAGLTDAFWAQR